MVQIVDFSFFTNNLMFFAHNHDKLSVSYSLNMISIKWMYFFIKDIIPLEVLVYEIKTVQCSNLFVQVH